MIFQLTEHYNINLKARYEKIEDDIWKDFFIQCLLILKPHIKAYCLYFIIYPISVLGILFSRLHCNLVIEILQELILMYLAVLISNISFLLLYHLQDKAFANIYFWLSLIVGFILFYCIFIYFLLFSSIIIAPNLAFIYAVFSLIKNNNFAKYRLQYMLYGMLFSCVCFLATMLSIVFIIYHFQQYSTKFRL